MNILSITGLLFLWNFAVIRHLSRWVYGYVSRFEDVPAEYMGRKVIRILGGGVTVLLVQVFYEGVYWLVTVSAFLLACYIF